jgi:NAD(P)-dependent dehydrogenase (short-subunit alcohol dehydrogenase family)
MDLSLGGRCAIITGATGGLGLAITKTLAAEGANIALVARNPSSLDAAAASVRNQGVEALAVTCDSRDDASVQNAVARVEAEFGGADILVNAAARSASTLPASRLASLTDAQLESELDVKVLGYLRFMRAVAPYMISKGWGRIINIAGLNARHTGSLVGSVRNVAVAAMTKNLADELGPHGVNVTVVHPGITITERTEDRLTPQAAEAGVSVQELLTKKASATSLGRLCTAEEVAWVVAFLASPRSVAITGDAIAVGGGSRGVINY